MKERSRNEKEDQELIKLNHSRNVRDIRNNEPHESLDQVMIECNYEIKRTRSSKKFPRCIWVTLTEKLKLVHG